MKLKGWSNLCPQKTGNRPSRSLDVKTLLHTVGLHKVYVQAVGKPSILNHVTTTALNYQPVDVTVTSQTSGTVTSPFTVTAAASSSATVTGWHIYANGADKFDGGQQASITAPITITTPGTYTIIVRAGTVPAPTVTGLTP